MLIISNPVITISANIIITAAIGVIEIIIVTLIKNPSLIRIRIIRIINLKIRSILLGIIILIILILIL